MVKITAEVQDTMFELPYVAGIIDGEGCISIYTNSAKSTHANPRVVLAVSVTNTNYALLAKLSKEFGGGGVHPHRAKKYNKNARESWTWTIVEQKAGVFLRRIYPWLFIKRKQAELAFELEEAKTRYRHSKKGRGHGNKLTKQEYQQRVRIAKGCRILNMRGAKSENYR